MKNLNDFRKTVETGVNPRQLLSLILLPVKWFVLAEKHTICLEVHVIKTHHQKRYVMVCVFI